MGRRGSRALRSARLAMVMPRMDGYQSRAETRSNDETRRTAKEGWPSSAKRGRGTRPVVASADFTVAMAGILTGTGRMKSDIDQITGDIIDAAMKLHMRLGPGLLESVYEALLAEELRRRGLAVNRQYPAEFRLDGRVFKQGFKVDLLVNELVVVELKSQEQLAAVHWKQVLTYLRALHLPVGLLINFGGATLKEGLHRVVNNYHAPPTSPLRVNATRHLESPRKGSPRPGRKGPEG